MANVSREEVPNADYVVERHCFLGAKTLQWFWMQTLHCEDSLEKFGVTLPWVIQRITMGK